MEVIPQYLLLIGYHFLFYRKFYRNPYLNSTGEVLSTYFPHWIWTGRNLRRGKSALTDRIYYQYPVCIPFLSTFYPPHYITAFLSSFLSIDKSFCLYGFTILIHSLLTSFLSFHLALVWAPPWIAFFFAITVSYSAYMIKPNTPCAMYTMAWLPGILIGGWVGALSLGMAILGGYWPILIYFLPVSVAAYFFWDYSYLPLFCGILIGLPQIITFMWYLPKSVRHKQKTDRKFGAVPWWRFSDLVLPNYWRASVNGVLFPESAMYLGFAPLFLIWFGTSNFGWVIFFSLVGMLGFYRGLPRISARFTHLFTFSMAWVASTGLEVIQVPLELLVFFCMIHCFDLLKNADIYPIWPFSEWWRRPSFYWSSKPEPRGAISRTSNLRYPYFTGYMTETRTLGYTGGFALRAVSEFHGITDPNGERVKTCKNENFMSGRFSGDILEEIAWLTRQI